MTTNNNRIQLWGGVECTINRVGDRYFNQLQRSGHWSRFDDLHRFAELGVAALRFPLLWEALAPNAPDEINWDWSDPRMECLRSLGIAPIAGLLHHGSGPAYTDLLDPEFPQKFARYARAVAERYPWIDAYTPINEPLTTARFSGLYGHWFPHHREERSFTAILLNQCRGIALAMKEIRKVNPSAQLIQTDDLGRSSSTPALRYQADFENERRWLTWDLLGGAVDRNHPLWNYLMWAGVTAEELSFFGEHPMPPDVIGVNYYVTSERFLTEDLEEYPVETHGGNGRHRYADDAAVRSAPDGIEGVTPRIVEAWERYSIPVALTEVHLGCTLDEQIRWFMEMWRGAEKARSLGCDVRALTAWALLGSFDWDALVTRQNGSYEPGAFDVRGPVPRATLIALAIRQLSAGEGFDHPALETPGWWRRPTRLRFPLQLSGTGSILD
jgi:dTDP-4-dehydrorhamnose reductase